MIQITQFFRKISLYLCFNPKNTWDNAVENLCAVWEIDTSAPKGDGKKERGIFIWEEKGGGGTSQWFTILDIKIFKVNHFLLS